MHQDVLFWVNTGKEMARQQIVAALDVLPFAELKRLIERGGAEALAKFVKDHIVDDVEEGAEI